MIIDPKIYLRGTNTVRGCVIRSATLQADQVRVEDLADTLAKICRFGGRTLYPYSVAQHAVLTSWLAPEEFAFEALHHDDSEAYTGYGDALGPSKTDDQRALEQLLRVQAIAPAFGLATFEPAEVKEADLAALAYEQLIVQGREDLDAFSVPPWPSRGALWLKEQLAPWHWTKARDTFLERHWELYGVG